MRSAADLASLAHQRTWDKELVLWVGPEKALRKALKPLALEMLDLLDLFDEAALPADDDDTRDTLKRGLRSALQTYRPSPERKVVLIVKSIGLLARYGADLRDFYEWFIGDFAMVVLLLEGTVEATAWPEEVRCDPERLQEKFTLSESVRAAYGEGQ